MYFVIRCLDKPGAAELRAETVDAHRAYLAASQMNVFVGGPVVAERDETQMIGSLMLVGAESLEDVERFASRDPLNLAGVWDTVEIHRFVKRVDTRA